MTKQELLQKTEVFLLDLDGTVYLSGTPIGDMLNTLATLRKMGKRLIYLTNNSSKTEEEYVKMLKANGFWGEGDAVFSSATAAIGYLNGEQKGKKVHLLATPAVQERFANAGVVLDEENPDICLMAYDMTLDFAKMKAFNENLHKDTLYMVTHGDIVCPTKGVSMPDVGSFIKMFEATSGRLPQIVCGKPDKIMAEEIERFTGVSRDKMCMVGDRLYTDIRFGNNNEITTICVLSGEATTEDLEISTDVPDLVLDSFNDVVKE